MGKRTNRYDVYRMKHFQVPKVFFTNEKYNKLSNDAKVAWAIFDDRSQLSEMNEWFDDNGDIYFIFRQDEICEVLNCRTQKWQAIKKELVEAGLLEFERQGLNKPNLMYVLQPEVTDEDIYKIKKTEEKRVEPYSRKEVRKSNFRENKGNLNIKLQEIRKSNSNDTELNDPDFKDSSSSSSSKGELQEADKKQKELNAQQTSADKDQYPKTLNDPKLADLIKYYCNVFHKRDLEGRPKMHIEDILDYWKFEEPFELIEEAIAQAEIGDKAWNYAYGTLKSWRDEGIKTLEQAKESSLAFERAKKKSRQYSKKQSNHLPTQRVDNVPDYILNPDEALPKMSDEERTEKKAKLQNFLKKYKDEAEEEKRLEEQQLLEEKQLLKEMQEKYKGI